MRSPEIAAESQQTGAVGRHRRRHLACSASPSDAVPAEGTWHPVDGIAHFLSSTAGRAPSRAARHVRARLVQRLGGEGQRAPPARARAPGRYPHLRFDRRGGRADATGSSPRSTPTPATGRWPGSTTPSTTRAALGAQRARRRPCSWTTEPAPGSPPARARRARCAAPGRHAALDQLASVSGLLVVPRRDVEVGRAPRRSPGPCRRRRSPRARRGPRRTRGRSRRSPSPPASPSSAAISSWSSRPDVVDRARQRLGRLDLDPPVALEPRRGRDQLADDHVLLEAVEAVDLALERRVGQHLRGLLEGGRRQERVRVQRGLGDAEDDVLELRGLACPSLTVVVDAWRTRSGRRTGPGR